jgi:putative transport protein
MKRGGLSLSLGALFMILAGLLTALVCKAWFGFSKEITAGLFAGALTSTPGLAVAVELAHSNSVPAAYGVAYAFGVVGVVLVVKLLPKVMRTNIAREEETLERELRALHPQMEFTHLRVTNPALCTAPVWKVLPRDVADVTITRVLRAGRCAPELATAETVLGMNDTIRAVGTREALSDAEAIVGIEVEADLTFNSTLIKRKILLSRVDVAGKTLRALNLGRAYGVQVSRITRNGFDCPAGPNVRLQHGDVLHVVGKPESLENVKKLLGDDVRALFATSVMTLLAGLFCGIAFGSVPLYLPGAGVFTLGSTGGVLLAGLFFGAMRQVGPVITELPSTSNALIRDLGLGLFLAVVGTAAGASFLPTLREYGFQLFLAGAVMTLTPMIVGVPMCTRVLRIPFLRMLGVITGGMTSTPGLAAASSLSATSYPATAYASVYPVALVGMIMSTKIIMLLG